MEEVSQARASPLATARNAFSDPDANSRRLYGLASAVPVSGSAIQWRLRQCARLVEGLLAESQN